MRPIPRLSRSPVPLLPVLILLSSGCGREARSPDLVLVRDSAGVEIVENGGAAWKPGAGWRLSPEPSREIGEAEGADEYRFVRITGALRRSDGAIVVADAGVHELRFYDARGSFVRRAGGKGQGPGEFEQMGSAFQLMRGDSLVAYDVQLRRFSFFSSEGEFLRASTFDWSPTGFPRPVGVLDDGSLLVSINGVIAQGATKEGLVRHPATYLRATFDGEVLDTVATVPGSEQYVAASAGGLAVTPPLFGRYPVQALRGDRIAVASNDAYEVSVYSAAGALERVIRRAREPRPITDADWDGLMRRNLEGMDSEWRGDVQATYRKMTRPPAMPFFSSALFDDAGNLWLESFRAPSDARAEWTVFDRGGRMLGTVAFPDGFRPTHIGGDFVLGVAKDDLDVEYVREYGLLKDGGSA